jgi:hypothetical protein
MTLALSLRGVEEGAINDIANVPSFCPGAARTAAGVSFYGIGEGGAHLGGGRFFGHRDDGLRIEPCREV